MQMTFLRFHGYPQLPGFFSSHFSPTLFIGNLHSTSPFPHLPCLSKTPALGSPMSVGVFKQPHLFYINYVDVF